jgi:hypothetical protein
LWWLEHELVAVHDRLEQALVELRRLMGTMSAVRTHEVALLTENKEAVCMIRIQKGMKVCPLNGGTSDGGDRSTVRNNGGGEKIFEEAGAMDWQEEMRDNTWDYKERMELVVDAWIEEMDNATREGRVYVVHVHATPGDVSKPSEAAWEGHLGVAGKIIKNREGAAGRHGEAGKHTQRSTWRW